MTLFTSSLESGSNGVTVSTANSGNPSAPFDVVTIGSGGVLAYDNTHAAHGTLACKTSTGVTSANAFAAWSTSFPSWAATMYYRIYLYFTANPASNFDVVCFQDSGGTNCGKIRVSNGGKVALLDSANANRGTSTNNIPTNAWFRLDGFLTGSATAGQLQAAIYTGSGGDSTTALETVTSISTLNTNATPGQCHYGHAGSNAASIGPFWWDDAALSDQGSLIGWADYLSTGTGTQDTGAGTDGGTGPSGGTHEEIGIFQTGG